MTIPPVEERQVRPCEVCHWYYENLDNRRCCDQGVLRGDYNCTKNITEDEILELIDQHNQRDIPKWLHDKIEEMKHEYDHYDVTSMVVKALDKVLSLTPDEKE
jgi:hypothetical protein